MNKKQDAIVVSNFADLSGYTIKLKVNDALMTVTEGVDFSSTPNNEITARNIAIAISRKKGD